MITATLDDELSFTGKLRNQKTDYFAYNYRRNNTEASTEDRIKSISENKGELEIINLEIKNVKKLDSPITESYEFSYEEGVEEIGAELYVSPLLFLSETENIFNKEKRTYPIDFGFPLTSKNIINIKFPSGYRIKYIPESVKMLMSDGLGEYSFLIKQNGNSIQISEVFKVNFQIIPVSHYSDVKEVYKKLIEKNAEKIVLEKI